MNRRPWIWTAAAAALFLLSAAFFFAPPLFAQPAPGAQPPAPASTAAQSQRYAQLLQWAMNFLSSRFVDQVDQQKLFEGAMQGMLDSLGDPYSSFLTEADLRGLNDTTSGVFGGVGLYINKTPPGQGDQSDPRNRFVEVVAPIDGTPASRAGVQTGDLITRINDEDTGPMLMDEVLSKLRGQPDTKVRISILRGGSVTFEYELTRAVIEVPTVRAEMLSDGIGYLRIIQFTGHTAERFLAMFQDLERQGLRSLIIDLRSNPGGLLEAVVRTADYFFSEGPLVSTRSRVERENQVFNADQSVQIRRDLPVLVLIDKGSASASEILAGALKDRQRAFILGANSYGKASVQQVIPFDATGFKLTTARYFTPAGNNIDKVGVAPHREFGPPELTEAELEAYKLLVESGEIERLVAANKNPAPAQLRAWADSLKPRFALPERWLLRWLRAEVWRANNQSAPLVDLEFDVTLAEAVRMLKAGEAVIPPGTN